MGTNDEWFWWECKILSQSENWTFKNRLLVCQSKGKLNGGHKYEKVINSGDLLTKGVRYLNGSKLFD